MTQTHIVPIPDGAEGVVISTAPDVAVTALMPEANQTVEVSDNGGLRFEYRRPRLAVRQIVANEQGHLSNAFTLHHIRGYDSLTGMVGGPYQVGNVHPSGGICWGGVAPPKTLRTFMGAFFGSPFNRDLAPGNRPGSSDNYYNEVSRRITREWDAMLTGLRADPVRTLNHPEPGPIPEPANGWFGNVLPEAEVAESRRIYDAARVSYSEALSRGARARGVDVWEYEAANMGFGETPINPDAVGASEWTAMRRAAGALDEVQVRTRATRYALSTVRNEAETYGRHLAYETERPTTTPWPPSATRLTTARRTRWRRIVKEAAANLVNPQDSVAFHEWADALLSHRHRSHSLDRAINARYEEWRRPREEALMRELRPDVANQRDAFAAWFAGGYAAGARDGSVGQVIGGSRYVKVDTFVPFAFVSSAPNVRALAPPPGRWVAGFAVPTNDPAVLLVAVPGPGGHTRFTFNTKDGTCALAQS